MGRTALRRATVVLTAALVLTVTFSPVAHAADAGLTAAMLDTGDLPAGFTPDASLTGPLTAQRAQDLGLNPGQSWSRDTSVRTWLAADGAVVVETAVDAGTGDHARAGAASGVSMLKEQGATRQPVAGFDVYGGFVGQYFELVLPLARGPYLFGLHVLVPASSAGSAGRLMSELGAAQVRKVPADTPDTARPSDAPAAAGAVAGALIGYLLLANGVGYLRNPLRRKPWRPRSRRAPARRRRLRRRRRRRRCVGGRHGAAAGSPSGGWRSSWPAWAWWPTRPTCSRSASGTRTWRPGWPSSGPAAGSSVPPERAAAEPRDHGRVAPGPGHRHAGRGVGDDPVRPGGHRGLRPVSDPAAGSHRAGPAWACRDLACPGWARSPCRTWPRAWRRRGLACWSWARSSSWSPGAWARPTRAG